MKCSTHYHARTHNERLKKRAVNYVCAHLLVLCVGAYAWQQSISLAPAVCIFSLWRPFSQTMLPRTLYRELLSLRPRGTAEKLGSASFSLPFGLLVLYFPFRQPHRKREKKEEKKKKASKRNRCASAHLLCDHKGHHKDQFPCYILPIQRTTITKACCAAITGRV